MEFTSLEVSASSVFLHLKHPASGDLLWHKEPELDLEGNVLVEGEAVGVYIYSMDSEAYAKRKRVLLDRRLETAAKRNAAKPTGEDVAREELLTIAACLDYFQNIELDGQPVGNDREKFLPFLKKFNWAKEQIDRGIADRGLFLKASPKT